MRTKTELSPTIPAGKADAKLTIAATAQQMQFFASGRGTVRLGDAQRRDHFASPVKALADSRRAFASQDKAAESSRYAIISPGRVCHNTA